jgi:hypothetical protein
LFSIHENEVRMNRMHIFGLAALCCLAVGEKKALRGAIISDDVFVAGAPVVVMPEAPGVIQFAPAFFPAPGIPNSAVLLFEDAAMTIVSDQIYVQNQQFYFASDPDLQNLAALGIPVVGGIVEDGTPQDVSAFFGGAIPIAVLSDVESVPEPATIALLSMGMAGMAGYVWRRRRIVR